MPGLMDTANVAAAWWSEGMRAALLESAILAMLAFIFTRSLRRTSSALHFWVWMLAPLRLLAMPFPEIPAPVLPASTTQQAAQTDAGSIIQVPVAAPLDPETAGAGAASDVGAGDVAPAAEPANDLAASVPRLGAEAYWMAAWLAGAALATARLVRASRRAGRLKRNARQAADARLLGLGQRAADMAGLSGVPRVLVVDEDTPPFVAGIRRPVVVLSTRFVRAVTDGQLLAVLTHECAHIRRRDALWGLFLGVCEAGFFFNPFFYWAKRQALIEREKACDSCVLAAQGATRSGYARAILAAAQIAGGPARFALAHVPAESFGSLRQRLAAISSQRAPKQRLSVGEVLVLAVLGLVCIPNIELTERAIVRGTPPAPARFVAPGNEGGSAPVRVEPVAEDTGRDATFVAADSSAPVVPGSRILPFPGARSAGRVSVRDASVKRAIDTYYYWIDGCDWEELGEAVGDVVVPAGKLVKLDLRADGMEDWSWLDAMPPDALYNVTVLSPRPSLPPIGDGMMQPISSLTGLRELQLQYSAVTDHGLAALKAFANLERLWMPPGVTDAAMAQVAKLPALTALYINTETRLTAAGLRHLKALPHLKELAIGGPHLGNSALKHLAALPELEYLLLWGGDHFGDLGMKYLQDVPSLGILNVSRCGISDAGLRYISRLPNLERLSLYGVNSISDEGLASLAALPRLRMLDVNDSSDAPSPITDRGIAYLAGCPELQYLHLPDTVTDQGLAHAAGIQGLRYLWAGCSSTGPITDAGLKQAAALRDLEHLYIGGGDGITDQGLAHLSGLRRLKSLLVITDSSHVTDEGVARLARLRELTDLRLDFSRRNAHVTAAGINHLNTLGGLRDLSLSGIKKGGAVLDLSNLTRLEKVSLGMPEGMKDEDLACLSGLTQLRWLQGVGGITDRGMAYLAGLTNLERLSISKSPGLTDDGLRYVGNMRRLTVLNLGGGFTEAGLQHLEELKSVTVATFTASQPISDKAVERMLGALPNLRTLNGKSPAGYGG